MYLRYFVILLVCLLVLAVSPVHSQAIDTLQLVNTLHQNKQIEASEKLLAVYHGNHPGDFNAIWLYAQTAYWLKHFKTSRNLYEKGIQLQPDNAYFQLDYARMLLNTRRYKKSGYWLNKLKDYSVTSSAARMELARLDYWRGNNLKARKWLKEMPDRGADPETRELFSSIVVAGAPWLKFNTAFQIDTQPLETISLSLESGVALSHFFSPYAGIYSPVYFNEGNVHHAKMFVLGNKTVFSSPGTELSYNAGFVRYPGNGSSDWISRVSLDQKIFNHLSLTIENERKPYFSTVASLDTAVLTRRFFMSLNLANENGFSGKIGFERNSFEDENHVYAAYGYLLTPPIRFGKVSVLLGYSYAYHDSREDRFRPVGSLPEIIASQGKGNSITGYYDPYFTPLQQSVHSAVFSLLVQPGPAIKFGMNVSPALMATTWNPYFYLESKGVGKFALVKDYSRISFHPLEGSAYLEWKTGKKFMMRAEYAYRHTFFYESNFVSLNLISRIWK